MASTAAEPFRAARPLVGLALLAALLGLLATLSAAWEQDFTYDEPYHMQWARRLLYERISERKSDPLWNSKTPVMMAHVLAKQAGRALGARGGRPQSLWARLPSVLCYPAVLGLTFVFVRRRAGAAAAALAALGLALDPSLIAHSAVATVDAPYTLVTLLTLLAAVRYAENPGLARGALVGLCLGLAFATKFTAFLLVPGLLLLPLCYGLAPLGGWRGLLRAAALIALVAAATVSAAYLFVSIAQPLGASAWKSGVMTRLAAALPGLRLPLPADFLTGLDICLAHERGRAWAVLILDRRYPDGVWWYFLVSWLLKTPLLLALSQLLGLFRLLRRGPGELRAPALFLGLNLLLSLAYFSLLFRAQIGYRYVLMCLPLLAALVALGLVALPGRRLLAGAAVVTLASVLELLPYRGDALAFTSVLVEPKTRAFRYLTNSSIDWGQNDEQVLGFLAAERARQPGTAVLFEPTHIQPGVNVIGLNSLAGAASYPQHAWLRARRDPEGHFRHTYFWFTIDDATYERFLDEDRRLRPRPEDEAACAPGPALVPAALDSWRAFPQNPGRSNAWIACLRTPRGADLALVGERTGLLLGRAGTQMRDWDQLRAGEELVYRLEPGWHALAVVKMELFGGHFEARRGAAELWLRPALLRKGGRLEPYEPETPAPEGGPESAPE